MLVCGGGRLGRLEESRRDNVDINLGLWFGSDRGRGEKEQQVCFSCAIKRAVTGKSVEALIITVGRKRPYDEDAICTDCRKEIER